MSPSPTDRAAPRSTAAERLQALRGGVTRAWASARGRLRRHVAYLHEEGVVTWPAGGGPSTSSDSFAAWCAVHPGADVDVRVTGHAIHSLVIDAALPLADADAVRRYALQQFTHYHGPQAAAWSLAVWAEGAQRGACGLHGFDLDALRGAADAHDVRLRSFMPAWSAGLTMLMARRPALAGAGRHAVLLVEGCGATWIVVDAGAVVALRQRYLDAPRVDAVARLLDALVREGEPLAGLPMGVGWGIDAPASLSADIATTFGDLAGGGALAGWMTGDARAHA